MPLGTSALASAHGAAKARAPSSPRERGAGERGGGCGSEDAAMAQAGTERGASAEEGGPTGARIHTSGEKHESMKEYHETLRVGGRGRH